mgnify:FL=1
MIVLGSIAPIALMLLGWWGTLWLLGDTPWIPWMAGAGFLAGLTLDATILRSRLGSLYTIPWPALVCVAVFYSVLIYGFFMAFPVPNLIVGILGGFVVGSRHGGDRIRTLSAEHDARIAAVVSAGILFVLCCVTAWLALTEPTITSQVQHMLGLPFEPTIGLLRVVTLIGGLGLVAVEYFATLATADWARRAGPAGTAEDRR